MQPAEDLGTVDAGCSPEARAAERLRAVQVRLSTVTTMASAGGLSSTAITSSAASRVTAVRLSTRTVSSLLGEEQGPARPAGCCGWSPYGGARGCEVALIEDVDEPGEVALGLTSPRRPRSPCRAAGGRALDEARAKLWSMRPMSAAGAIAEGRRAPRCRGYRRRCQRGAAREFDVPWESSSVVAEDSRTCGGRQGQAGSFRAAPAAMGAGEFAQPFVASAGRSDQRKRQPQLPSGSLNAHPRFAPHPSTSCISDGEFETDR
jgi:hypothetical protein